MQWGIAQKQTGADSFTLGGSVSANCHGRGLDLPPIVADVEALTVVRPDGRLVTCSRQQHAELFRLVVGGYGLFGVICSVTLRLVPRVKLQRQVELATSGELPAAFRHRIAAGFRYGDFQFAIDPASPDFLRRGILSCYQPVDPATPMPADQKALSRRSWEQLLGLAHTDKAQAFREYARHYLATSGQLYWSDLHQLAEYVDGYHESLDREARATAPSSAPASEMIGEMYVPLGRLPDYLSAAAEELRRERADVIYGTVRLIRRDTDTFLPWARDDYACVVLNLHTHHDEAGTRRSAGAFRRLIDLAISRGGSYYLTYHRWATREQVLACYPQLPALLDRKRADDPGDLLTSDWYRHQTRLLADVPVLGTSERSGALAGLGSSR